MPGDPTQRSPRVLLLSMPWAALAEPSLGLGVLKSSLLGAGIDVRVRHLNLFLLRHLTASTYVGLANAYAVNDFVFTGDLDPVVSGTQYRLARRRVAELRQVGLLRTAGADDDGAVQRLLEARADLFPRWLEECTEEVVRADPTLVGFTCLFDQTLPSVVLARRIRERLPDVTIALGGYALEGPVGAELLRCFPWIDAVCAGEGEPAVVELARASVGQRRLEGIPNVLTRDSAAPRLHLGADDGLARRAPVPVRAPFVPMDQVPVPDFDDWFADLTELREVDRVEVETDTLPVESSRGCWWGQRQHCVFCGIDDETLTYRSRSAEGTLAMLDQLHERYDVNSFRFSDYILPHNYFRDLLPALAARGAPYHLECEIKANLDDQAFRALRAAGFEEVQPGIESFSTPVLRRMAKGITGLRNVQTLLLGRTHGVRVHWNLLFGFPDDELADYEALVQLVPMLYHLDPPHGCQQVEITRFAPLQADPARFGLSATGHAPLYDLVFSDDFLARSGFDLDAYAYYFRLGHVPTRDLRRCYDALVMQVEHWKQLRAQRSIELSWRDEDDDVVIVDTRFDPAATPVRLTGVPAGALRTCSAQARTAADVAAELDVPEPVAREALCSLVDERLMVAEGRRFLTLATPAAGRPTRSFRRKWVTA